MKVRYTNTNLSNLVQLFFRSDLYMNIKKTSRASYVALSYTRNYIAKEFS